MSHTLEILSEIEHGTVAGYRSGCHGSTTSCGAVVSCTAVYSRYQGDWGFRKRVDAGESPIDIVLGELAELDAVRARDKAANRKVKADGALSAASQEQKRRRQTVVPDGPADSVASRIVEDVRRLSDDGKTIIEIAVSLGVSTSTVVRSRRLVGLTTDRMTIDRTEVTRLNAEGWSDTRIADHLNASNSAISAIRRNELHLPRVSSSRAPKATESARAQRSRRLTELHADGKTDIEIAEELDMTRTAVYQARGRLGLPLNRQTTRGPYKTAERPEPDTAHDEPQEAQEAVIREHGTQQGYTDGCRGRGCPTTPSCTDAALAAHRAARHAAGGQS